jgi:hypothetical protein
LSKNPIGNRGKLYYNYRRGQKQAGSVNWRRCLRTNSRPVSRSNLGSKICRGACPVLSRGVRLLWIVSAELDWNSNQFHRIVRILPKGGGRGQWGQNKSLFDFWSGVLIVKYRDAWIIKLVGKLVEIPMDPRDIHATILIDASCMDELDAHFQIFLFEISSVSKQVRSWMIR